MLVTGGAGFIGSAVVRHCVRTGHEVVNVDALTYASCVENLSEIRQSPNYFFEEVDIRDKDGLANVFSKYRPTAVLHLAAESHVDRSIDGPKTFIETNIVGTYNLLEVARKYWIERGCFDEFRFHHISTDEVFGSLGPTGHFEEESRYQPNNPYSASKAASDHLVRAWNKTFDLPVILTNCSNNYGPYQFPEKLIPLIIINAISNKTLPIYGDGSNIRDWLYVEDHASALLQVLQEGTIGRSYNIGGENEITNLELVKLICSILDEVRPAQQLYSDLITFVTDRPGHDSRYAMNISRIRSEIGWQPSVDLHEGLRKTVCWYLENEAWWLALYNRTGVGVRLGVGK